jgi:4-amino-4-deoxy-L-arabinose transferase-like glycosyltransferase
MRRWTWVVLLLILLLVAAIRIRVLDCPLERDEGEYAYVGQLMLQGVPPYTLAYTMKLPGTSAAYALIMAVFGQSAVAIHLGLLLVNVATIILVFLIGQKLFDPWLGVVAAAGFALLSVSPSVLGFWAHATHFVLLPAMLGVYMLVRKPVQEMLPIALGLAGVSMGLAFLMKQPGVFYIVFGGWWICWDQWRAVSPRQNTLRFGIFIAGAFLPLLLLCAVLLGCGVFGSFWFWTVDYARSYGTLSTPAGGWENFKHGFSNITTNNLWVWLTALGGLITVFLKKEKSRTRRAVTGLLVFSFLAVSPGLYFREHYFVLMLPVVALLAAAAVGFLRDLMDQAKFPAELKHGIPAALFIAGIAWSAFAQQDFFSVLTPQEISRKVYGDAPFIESIPVADYIQKHSGPSATVAVLGSEPEIYFLSRRHSATGYIYMYGLMEPQPYALQMQKEMIAEIEKAKPEYLVAVTVYESWLLRKDSSRAILDWYTAYSLKNYDVVGVIDISPDNLTQYRWDDQAVNYTPVSPSHLVIHRRKAAAGG